MGHLVDLDEYLKDESSRCRFVGLLDASTEQLLRQGAFTEYGREWVATVVADLRARVLQAAR